MSAPVTNQHSTEAEQDTDEAIISAANSAEVDVEADTDAETEESAAAWRLPFAFAKRFSVLLSQDAQGYVLHCLADIRLETIVEVRRIIKEDYVKVFNDVDVIMGPVTTNTAFKLGEKVDDPVSMYLSDIYTIALNLAGLPGMSLPVEPVAGLPVGLQIIGNYFDEAKLLNVAHQFQQATSWHKQSPEGFGG